MLNVKNITVPKEYSGIQFFFFSKIQETCMFWKIRYPEMCGIVTKMNGIQFFFFSKIQGTCMFWKIRYPEICETSPNELTYATGYGR